MAGTIVADTLTHSTAGSIATNYVVEGSAKAWGHFEGSDTVLDDSFNTTSITDNGVGNYTVTIANSLNNANYSLSIGADWDVVSSNTCHGSSNSMATGSFVIRIRNGGSNVDLDNTTYNVVGDLA